MPAVPLTKQPSFRYYLASTWISTTCLALVLVLLGRYLRITWRSRTLFLKSAVIFAVLATAHYTFGMVAVVSIEVVSDKMPPTPLLISIPIATAVTILVTQEFLVYRLYRLSARDSWKRMLPCIFLATCAFLLFILSILLGFFAVYLPGYSKDRSKRSTGIKSLVSGYTGVDVLTTLCLFHYLWKIRCEGTNSTQRLVRRLAILATQTGLFPTLNTIAAVCVQVFSPMNQWIIVIQAFNTFCYAFTLLITLIATHRIMDPSCKASEPSRDFSRQLYFAETKGSAFDPTTQDSSWLQTPDSTGRFGEKEKAEC